MDRDGTGLWIPFQRVLDKDVNDVSKFCFSCVVYRLFIANTIALRETQKHEAGIYRRRS